MSSIYVTEQGAVVRKEANRLVVERGGEQLASVHDFRIDRVVLVGNVQLSTQAASFLLDHGIDTTFVTVHGRLKGRLAALESKNAPLRIRQYERVRDEAFALAVARSVVAAKILNCRELLARHDRNHPECALAPDIERLDSFARRAERASGRDSLLGVEGSAAALYFQGFARMLRRGFSFTKRVRRPPTDPVNSMLGFGYALLYGEAIAALASAGFDPYLGFFHTVDYGRCSLALDLMEEFRAVVVDRAVLAVSNRGALGNGDFERTPEDGVHLTADGRRRFIAEYERIVDSEFNSRQTNERTTLRKAIRDQAIGLQRVVMAGEPYRPFRGWH